MTTRIKYPHIHDLSSPLKKKGSRSSTPILTGFRSDAKLQFPVVACPRCYLEGYSRNLYPVRFLNKGRKCYFSEFSREEFYCKVCNEKVTMITDCSGYCTISWPYLASITGVKQV